VDSALDEMWLAHNSTTSRGANNAIQSDMVYQALSTIEKIIGKLAYIR